MKNVIVLNLLLSLLLVSCNQMEEDLLQGRCDYVDFKYFSDEQVFLGEMSSDYLFVGIDSAFSDDDIRLFISGFDKFDQSYNLNISLSPSLGIKHVLLKFENSKSCNQITQIISDLEQYNMVSYAHYTMQTDDCTNWFFEPMASLCVDSYISRFIVKLHNEDDLELVSDLMLQTNTELVEVDGLVCRLRATKSSLGDALTMANFFFESGLFDWAEPEMVKIAAEE